MKTKNSVRKHDKKLHVHSGDEVLILSGQHRGERGKVTKVIKAKDKALVEGKNLAVDYSKKSNTQSEGKMATKTMGIHVSNLQVINPTTGKPTRIGRKRDERGKLKRYAKATGEFI